MNRQSNPDTIYIQGIGHNLGIYAPNTAPLDIYASSDIFATKIEQRCQLMSVTQFVSQYVQRSFDSEDNLLFVSVVDAYLAYMKRAHERMEWNYFWKLYSECIKMLGDCRCSSTLIWPRVYIRGYRAEYYTFMAKREKKVTLSLFTDLVGDFPLRFLIPQQLIQSLRGYKVTPYHLLSLAQTSIDNFLDLISDENKEFVNLQTLSVLYIRSAFNANLPVLIHDVAAIMPEPPVLEGSVLGYYVGLKLPSQGKQSPQQKRQTENPPRWPRSPPPDQKN